MESYRRNSMKLFRRHQWRVPEEGDEVELLHHLLKAVAYKSDEQQLHRPRELQRNSFSKMSNIRKSTKYK